MCGWWPSWIIPAATCSWRSSTGSWVGSLLLSLYCSYITAATYIKHFPVRLLQLQCQSQYILFLLRLLTAHSLSHKTDTCHFLDFALFKNNPNLSEWELFPVLVSTHAACWRFTLRTAWWLQRDSDSRVWCCGSQPKEQHVFSPHTLNVNKGGAKYQTHKILQSNTVPPLLYKEHNIKSHIYVQTIHAELLPLHFSTFFSEYEKRHSQ